MVTDENNDVNKQIFFFRKFHLIRMYSDYGGGFDPTVSPIWQKKATESGIYVVTL